MKTSALPLRVPSPYYGWWIVASVFLAYALTTGSSQYAFGVFVGPLEETFGWSRTQISASLSFAAVGSFLAPFIGRIMDNYGAKPVMAVCLALMGVSYLLRPLMTELWHWYALSFLQYVGFAGAAGLPSGRLIGIWFGRTRGRVMGISAMGNNFGGLAVAPAIGIIFALTSWQGAYISIAVFAFLIAAFAIVVVRETQPKSAPNPQGGRQAQPRPTLTGWTVREATRTKAFYFMMAAMVLGTFTYSAILPQVTAHLTNEGFSVAMASAMLSLLAGMGMVGKLAFGYLAERITARYAMMLSFSGQAAGALLMSVAGHTPLMWLAIPLFGMHMGAFGALFQLMIQESFGIRYFGSIMGLVNMATVVSFAVGPILAGVSFDVTGGYGMAFTITAGMFLTGVLVLTQAGRPKLPSRAQEAR